MSNYHLTSMTWEELQDLTSRTIEDVRIGHSQRGYPFLGYATYESLRLRLDMWKVSS